MTGAGGQRPLACPSVAPSDEIRLLEATIVSREGKPPRGTRVWICAHWWAQCSSRDAKAPHPVARQVHARQVRAEGQNANVDQPSAREGEFKYDLEVVLASGLLDLGFSECHGQAKVGTTFFFRRMSKLRVRLQLSISLDDLSSVRVVGSLPELGGWDLGSALERASAVPVAAGACAGVARRSDRARPLQWPRLVKMSGTAT